RGRIAATVERAARRDEPGGAAAGAAGVRGSVGAGLAAVSPAHGGAAGHHGTGPGAIAPRHGLGRRAPETRLCPAIRQSSWLLARLPHLGCYAMQSVGRAVFAHSADVWIYRASVR